MFKKIITIFIISSMSLFAVQEDNIRSIVETNINYVLKVLKDKNLNMVEKTNKTKNVMDVAFDYKTMAQISLGKTWNKMSKTQRKSFSKAFEEMIKEAYLNKLKLYDNQKVEISNPIKSKSNRITLDSEIIGSDKNYKVKYLFFRKKNTKDWFIYDVNLVGVSLLKTYRKQFSDFLLTKNMDELIYSIQNKQIN